MDIESFRDYCISKKGVTEEFPFDQDTLVFKVMGKMFALTDVELFGSVTLKCDPENVDQLREQYPAVQPGYHMNKRFWNTIMIDGSVSDHLLREWIDHSYDLVVDGLTRKLKDELKNME